MNANMYRGFGKEFKKHCAKCDCDPKHYCPAWEWEGWLLSQPILTPAQKRREREDEKAWNMPHTVPCKCGHVRRSHTPYMGEEAWSLVCRYCECTRFRIGAAEKINGR